MYAGSYREAIPLFGIFYPVWELMIPVCGMLIFYWVYKLFSSTVFLRTLDIVAHGATHAALMSTSRFPLVLQGSPCRSSFARLGEQQPHSSRVRLPLSILLVLPRVFDGFRFTVFCVFFWPAQNLHFTKGFEGFRGAVFFWPSLFGLVLQT